MTMQEYEAKTGRTPKEVVAVLHPTYKGYTAQMHSKVRKPDYYGVTLTGDAWALLENTPQDAPKADGRKLQYRVSFRLNKRLYADLQRLKKARGYKTTQDFMAALIDAHIKNEKAASRATFSKN